MALILFLFLISHVKIILAETVYLTPSADTTLLQAFPSNNFGGQLYFNSGTTQTYTRNRGLLKFDIAAHLPANAKITLASLTLEVTGATVETDHDTPSTFELRRMLRDWGEGNKSGQPPSLGAPATTNEANWVYRFAFTTNTWSSPGGASGVDFSTVASGEQYVYAPMFFPISTFDSNPQMIADVQSWLNQPTNNFGWMLLTQIEGTNFTARRFGSRENTNRAPILEVNYFIPRINQVTVRSNVVELKFFAEANQTYTVEYRNGFGQNAWLTLTNLPAFGEPTNSVVKDFLSNTQRFYRLALP